MAYESFKDMTHKQLAAIVIATNRTNSREFENSEDVRDWARYYAELKKPWKPLPTLKKRELYR